MQDNYYILSGIKNMLLKVHTVTILPKKGTFLMSIYDEQAYVTLHWHFSKTRNSINVHTELRRMASMIMSFNCFSGPWTLPSYLVSRAPWSPQRKLLTHALSNMGVIASSQMGMAANKAPTATTPLLSVHYWLLFPIVYMIVQK